MNKVTSLACIAFLLTTWVSAQTPKRIHVTGSKAFRLVSLLASGSDGINKLLQDKREFVIHDLNVVSRATFKYDPDNPKFKLGIYAAWGKIESATNSTPIGEATALFELLNGLGLTTDTALEGTYLTVATINCKIDVTANIASPSRAQCDIVNPY
jgi:hypothetical protein